MFYPKLVKDGGKKEALEGLSKKLYFESEVASGEMFRDGWITKRS